jgi:stage II sporulation protein E
VYLLFEEVEIYPYRRILAGKKKKKAVRRFRGNKKHFLKSLTGQAVTPAVLALWCAGFFLGRAILFGELAPFGVAYIAAAMEVFGRAGLGTIPAVILGLVSVSRGLPLYSSILAAVGTFLLLRTIPAGVKKPWLVVPGLVAAVTIIVKISILAFIYPSPYDYFRVLFEAVFAALLTLVFLPALLALKNVKRPFSREEIFYLILLLGGLVAGIGELRINIISLKEVLSGLAILLAAFIGGSGMGAAAGAVMGIISGLVYVAAPTLIGTYSFVGLLAGLCRSFGRAGVAVGFLLGNIILSVYVIDYGNFTVLLVETGLAAFLFLVAPPLLVENLQSLAGMPLENVLKQEVLLKEALGERFHKWARVFREISRSFEQVSCTVQKDDQGQGLQKLLHLTGKKICSDCILYQTCWERELYKTYQGLLDFLALKETYGKAGPEDFPDELRRRCLRLKELAIAIDCLYETCLANRYWYRRLLENGTVVSEQLRGVADILENLPGEFEIYKGDTGPVLRRRLKEMAVQVENLTVDRRPDGAAEISVTKAPCGGRLECHEKIAPLLTSLVGQPFYLAATGCTWREGEGNCSFKLFPALNYAVALGLAGIGKGGSFVSGDCYSVFDLRGGRLALALSDGMGVGPQAALESGVTVSLLGSLLECGFSQNMAVKTINSVLVLRSARESFATVDLAVIDLNNGEADFIKIGAPASFLIRGKQVMRVIANSLPAGILEDIEVASEKAELLPGDVLVMVTDGVLDAGRQLEDKEEWLAGVLQGVAGLPVQEMAELILKLGQTKAGGIAKIPDDMTVLAARLIKQKTRAI